MKLKLDEIPEEGWHGSFDCRGLTAADFGNQIEALADAPKANLSIMPAGDGVFIATGKVEALTTLQCRRCLELWNDKLTADLAVSLLPGRDLGKDEVELAGDDMEVQFYQENELDLCELVLGELALAVPMAPVCSDDCPGICAACGKKHAPGQCAEKKETSDPRWAKLAQLKIDS